MTDEQVMIASFTYSHEARFLKSLLDEKGISYISKKVPSVLPNCFYSIFPETEQIYLSRSDLPKASPALLRLRHAAHIDDHCNYINFQELEKYNKPGKTEKKICTACYAVMFLSLAAAIYLIVRSIQVLL